MGHYKGECPKLANRGTPRGTARGTVRGGIRGIGMGKGKGNARKRARSPDAAPPTLAPGGSGTGRPAKVARDTSNPAPTPSKQGRTEW